MSKVTNGPNGVFVGGANVSIKNLSKYFGRACVLDNVSLSVKAGEFLTLLGPSGSGKTTTLMALAGFIEPSAGEIEIDGREVSRLPPHRRNIGVVFQHLALFPDMTVAQNVAFPLHMRGMPERNIVDKVDLALELVHLGGFQTRLPAQLSGGQQQRVALARAVIFEPGILLLDEPLGALDRKLREAMQVELKELHRRLRVTIVHVTHDQEEALAISDRIAVMSEGKILQIGSPEDLYERPCNKFVASFIGDANFLPGQMLALAPTTDAAVFRTNSGLELQIESGTAPQIGRQVIAMVRPERVLLGDDAASALNRFEGQVEDVIYGGEKKKYRIRLAVGDSLLAVAQNRRSGLSHIREGSRIQLGWQPHDMCVFTQHDEARR
jgi:putative spermidine/putrescine transport system ATP-binding protein